MIRIETMPTENLLTGRSKWWGEADMPEWMDYPEMMVTEVGDTWKEPLTFVCQIRCEELAALDAEGFMPHEGMLYFFAAIDYFLGDIDTPTYPGMGLWPKDYFRVLYSPSCDNLHTHHVVDEDGEPANLPAEDIRFSKCSDSCDGIRLLGFPYIKDVRVDMPDSISLLQMDECDRWHLNFHDCGTLNFLITPEDLRTRRWDKTECYLFSF